MSRSSSAPQAPAAERSVHAPNLADMVLSVTERHAGVALRFPDDGGWAEWSYAELGRRVRELARGLIALGVEPGDPVAVLGSTRPEWTLTDCAILVAGGTVVPVYHTNSAEECRYVLEHSGARAVICEDAAQVAKVAAIRDACPELRDVIGMAPVDGVLSLEGLAGRGAEVDPAELEERRRAIDPAGVATIVYTSGTTGPPKGCELSHDNLLSTMDAYERRLELGETAAVFLFLPLAHVLARVTQMVVLDVGGTLVYWGGDARRVLDEIAQARPTHVPSVPRVFEKIHTRALSQAGDAGGARSRLFDWALATGAAARAAERAGAMRPALRARHAIADRLVLSKVRDLFGGNLELALTGAAPVGQDVLEFFDACGVLVLEGYGLTETCAAATLNTEAAFRFGTVGRALPGFDVAIAEDGEILVRGPGVFAGYHADKRATAAALKDGWLLTGDLGSVDGDGFLRITGRKKDLIITSSGKNVTPANIELALRESRWISQGVVYGDNRPYLVALVTLDPDEAHALAAELGVPDDVAAMAAEPRVQATLQVEVDAINGHFARIEQIKRFAILEHDLTEAAGELTPTMKLKRAVVYERYRDRFDALYDA
jgi:long-chain acyl-CoA synthetase